MYGCDDNNQIGLQLENFISNNSLSFMNDKSITYLHPVTEDLFRRDHFPVILSSTQPSSNVGPQKWKLSKVNWNKFEALCEQSITHDKFEDCDDPTKLFTSLLIEAA